MLSKIAAKSVRFSFVAAFAALAGGCSTLESMIPRHGEENPGAPTRVSNDQGGNLIVLPRDALDIDCPSIEVQDGTSAVRVGGQTNESVRYQFNIAETARECQPQGDQFTIKVGVAGHLLIGPAGSPGAYSATLRVVVRRSSDQKPVISKTYRIEANTAGANEASYQLVTEPFALPFTHREMDQDYTILVGFDNGHGGIVAKPAVKRKRG